jgi:hypothetical protein
MVARKAAARQRAADLKRFESLLSERNRQQ